MSELDEKRETREIRESRETRESRDSRDSREPRETREPREPKEVLEHARIEEKAPEEPMDVEEFEPILSDEDIVDDPETFQEDYDYSAYTNNDDLIKIFTPGSTPLQKYEPRQLYFIDGNNLICNEYLRNVIGIVDDFFKSSITQYAPGCFEQLNEGIKEEFIHLTEKVTAMFEDVRVFCTIFDVYEKKDEYTIDTETVNQIENILTTFINWLEIALDYNMANVHEKPAYKIRHIKCGVRLADLACESESFIRHLWQRKYFIHDVLLSLYEREYMALSIKLMILKALDNYLLKKPMIEAFVMGIKSPDEQNGYHDLLPLEERSGYRKIVDMIQLNPPVRSKFALNSILKKLNIFDVLHKLRIEVMGLCRNEKVLTDEEVMFIATSLELILQTIHSGSFLLQQPKRFLPVIAQFEIIRDEFDMKDPLIELFKMQNFIEILLVLLTNLGTTANNNIKGNIFEIIDHLVSTQFGLEYLYDNPQSVNLLVKILLQGEEEQFHPDTLNSHHLGIKLAYKLQALYLLSHLADKKHDCDHFEVNDHLHALFCLTFSNAGKMAVAEVLGYGSNLQICLHYVRPEILPKVRKSPGVAYILDLLALAIVLLPNIPMLEIHRRQLMELLSQQDIMYEANDKRLISRMNEIGVYMRPFEQYNGNFDVIQLVEHINKSIGTITTAPANIISHLRILEYLGISKHRNKGLQQDNPLNNFIELKYKHVIIQLFTLDAVNMLGQVLQEICYYYEQPSLHLAAFVSSTGLLLVNIMAPCVALIKQTLTYVVQCRNTQFKDLTAVPILLQTFNLCQSYPATALGFTQARKICTEIIETLLVYTMPVSDEINEKDSLNKGLWTLLCAEIFKYTLSAPYTFIAGLSVFSELLPLPLPMQSLEELSEEEIVWAINLRKLWSAHLHCHSTTIQDLVGKLCTTSHQVLLNLLRKVCAQIADLASNSALMIARGVLDNVHSAIVIGDDVPKLVCNGHIARLMNFLACLVTHNCLKATVLHLLANTNGTKGDEKYCAIINAFAQILRSTSNITSHVSTQECILSIVQSFCDTEITMYQNASDSATSGDIYLANALPTKEYLGVFLNTIIDHINGDNSFMTYLPVLRILLFLTEHDYGFYHLRECLLKERKSAPFALLLSKLDQNFSKDNADCLTTLSTLIEFLRVCTEEENATDLPFTPRKMKMTIAEIQSTIGWQEDNTNDEHLFVKVVEKLKEFQVDDNSFDRLLESVQQMITMLQGTSVKSEEIAEPLLPAPESLVTQFASRSVFTSSDVVDERLTAAFWLTAVVDENETGDSEHVTCDLIDICRQDLSSDVNLIKQVEKLCRVCVTESSAGLVEKEKRNTQNDKMKRPFGMYIFA